MPDFHLMSLLQMEEEQIFNFVKFEQLGINSSLNVLTSKVLNGDVEPIQAKHNVFLCDANNSELVYQTISQLYEFYPEDNFYDNCLILLFDKKKEDSISSFRNEFYSNFKLHIPIISVKSELEAIKVLIKHQKLAKINPVAEVYKSSTQRFRELLNKINSAQ